MIPTMNYCHGSVGDGIFAEWTNHSPLLYLFFFQQGLPRALSKNGGQHYALGLSMAQHRHHRHVFLLTASPESM